MATFKYNSGDPTDGNSYTEVTSTPCSGTQKLCSIIADANASHKPVITTDLIAEMLIAVVTNTASTNVNLKA